MKKELTEQEKHAAFLRAVCSYQGSKDRWAKHTETGLSDEALKQVLKYELGIFGGSASKNAINVVYQGDGLKIWAGWTSPNHCMDEPIFEGTQTIKMARRVFNIADPANQQMDLFGGAQ